MNLDYNKALVRRVIEEVWNKGDLSVIPQLYAPNVVSHQSHSNVGDVQGADALTMFVREIREAFPDLHDTIDDLAAEGDKVVTRITSAGTHQGALKGKQGVLEPTNRRASWMAITIDRIDDGMIAEEWVSLDVFGMLQQLGYIISTQRVDYLFQKVQQLGIR